MKIKALAVISILSLLLGQLSAFATDLNQIAVIDVQKVISSSKQIKTIKKEKASRDKELKSIEKSYQSKIKKEKDLEKKKSLLKECKKQIGDKKSFYTNDYTVKIKMAKNDINEKIAKKAQELGYTMVLKKGSVIMSDNDITEDIIKVIK